MVIYSIQDGRPLMTITKPEYIGIDPVPGSHRTYALSVLSVVPNATETKTNGTVVKGNYVQHFALTIIADSLADAVWRASDMFTYHVKQRITFNVFHPEKGCMSQTMTGAANETYTI